jgi:tetratricopeptide (TPR) repeat protein
MAAVLTRCALVAVALLAGAWLVLGVRALELQSDGREVLARAQSGTVAADEVRHAQSLFQRARRLNADKTPLLDEAFLLSATGRRPEGISVAERLVEEEPDNVDGWIVVYLGSRQLGDSQRAAQALDRVRALNPLADEALQLRPAP